MSEAGAAPAIREMESGIERNVGDALSPPRVGVPLLAHFFCGRRIVGRVSWVTPSVTRPANVTGTLLRQVAAKCASERITAVQALKGGRQNMSIAGDLRRELALVPLIRNTRVKISSRFCLIVGAGILVKKERMEFPTVASRRTTSRSPAEAKPK